MLGDMFLWLVANLKQGVIYFIKQALPPNISAGSVHINYALSYFFRQPMILAQFAFLKGTLQSELPSRVSCSFSLSSLPFCAFCPNAEGAKICLLQGLPYTVVPTPILHILLIAAKIATQKKTPETRNKNHRFYRQYFFFLFCKERKKEKNLPITTVN